MKLLLTSVVMLIALTTTAQNDEYRTINRDSVKLLVSDAAKETHYPKLLRRLNNLDSTLTLEDYRLLYYGFVFQEDYSGYADIKKKEITALINKKDYEAANRLCDTVLAENPVTLPVNYYKGLCVFLMDKENPTNRLYAKRYTMLRDAVLSSGNGLTCETAFRTIMVSDEYELMYNYFEIEKIKGQALVTPCDKMSIERSKYFDADFMYFNTIETLLSMQEMFKKKD